MEALSKFQRYQPVDDETAKKPLQKRKGDLRLRLYFGDAWRTCLWNKHVLQDMVKDMQHELKEAGEEELTPEAIVACLWISVTQAQNSWKTMQIRVHKSGERLETAQEASSRAAVQDQSLTYLRKMNKRKHDVNTFNLLIHVLLIYLVRNTRIGKRPFVTLSKIRHWAKLNGSSGRQFKKSMTASMSMDNHLKIRTGMMSTSHASQQFLGTAVGLSANSWGIWTWR